MDGRRFDAIVRNLGAVTSRRTALKGLLGGVLGGAVATVATTDDAGAICGGRGVRCNRNQACCSGHCEWTTTVRGKRRYRTGACACIGTGQNGCGTNSRSCCDGLTCRDNTCCTADAGNCADDSDCCSGMCYLGVCLATCRESTANSAWFTGVACDSNADCCTGNCFVSQGWLWGVCKDPVGHACSQNHHCASGHCNENTKLCYQLSAGESCGSDIECAGGNCDLTKGWCAQLQFGSPCTDNFNCISGVCTGGYCGLLADGQQCQQDASCSGGYCYSGTCHSTCATSGFGCSSDSDCCNALICFSLGSTCIAANSVSNGQYCGDNRECSSGYCDVGNTGQCQSL